MADIVHKISINAPLEKVYEAITTIEGLKNWWTAHAEGNMKEGATLSFHFPKTGPIFEVLEIVDNEIVKWKCTGGVEEWKGTILIFEMENKKNVTELLLAQTGWKSQSDLFAHSNTKWGVYLLSLKEYLETGKGRPFPDDINIGK